MNFCIYNNYDYYPIIIQRKKFLLCFQLVYNSNETILTHKCWGVWKGVATEHGKQGEEDGAGTDEVVS